MEITLLNYRNDKIHTKGFPNIDEIPSCLVTITVIYGDEVISVEDGSGEPVYGFMSDSAVFPGGFDGAYTVYYRNGLKESPEVDLINDPAWLARKDSYEFLYA